MGTAILAGCGGSSTDKRPTGVQTVRGPSFTFQAPSGWRIARLKNRVSATSGDELVQVALFPLRKAYDDKLFRRVSVELQARMRDIAGQTGGTVTAGRTVSADGVRSHAYAVTAGSRVDEYTFVFSGKREYLLLCRRASSDGVGVCKQLVTSFARR